MCLGRRRYTESMINKTLVLYSNMLKGVKYKFCIFGTTDTLKTLNTGDYYIWDEHGLLSSPQTILYNLTTTDIVQYMYFIFTSLLLNTCPRVQVHWSTASLLPKHIFKSASPPPRPLPSPPGVQQAILPINSKLKQSKANQHYCSRCKTVNSTEWEGQKENTHSHSLLP